MVCARTIGRRWVLRSCGHALFTGISQDVAAGIAAFEDSEDYPEWDAWVAALHGMGKHVPELIRSWTLMKARLSVSDLEIVQPVCCSSFFYVFSLADSRGFFHIVKQLQSAWDRASSGLGEADKQEWDNRFLKAYGLSLTGFDFLPFEQFLGDRIFVGRPVNQVPGGSEGAEPDLVKILFEASVGLLNAELLSVLYFTGVLEVFNSADTELITAENYAQVKARGLGDLYEEVLNA